MWSRALFMQNGLGPDMLTVGLILLPGGPVQNVLASFIGRIYDMVGPRPPVIPGAVLQYGGEWWMPTMTHDTSVGVVVARDRVLSVGLALLITPLTTTTLACLSCEL